MWPEFMSSELMQAKSKQAGRISCIAAFENVKAHGQRAVCYFVALELRKNVAKSLSLLMIVYRLTA